MAGKVKVTEGLVESNGRLTGECLETVISSGSKTGFEYETIFTCCQFSCCKIIHIFLFLYKSKAFFFVAILKNAFLYKFISSTSSMFLSNYNINVVRKQVCCNAALEFM